MVEELLILCSWITAVVALLAVCGWKATAVASAGVWIAFHASFALVPDVSGDGPLLPGMIAAIGGGCIEGLLFFMLAKWLFHIMDRLWKMVASYCRQAGSEAQRICSEQKYSFQFRASILIPIGALVLIPLIWLGVVLHGILMDTRTVSQYSDLRPCVGRSFFSGRVRLLWFSNPELKPSDARLMNLIGLPKLRALLLPYSDVTDRGLQFLEGLPHLAILKINSSQMTDAGLAHLRTLTNLSDLDLGDTKITDTGLQQLGGLKNLQVLNLSRTNVTDAGLDSLISLPQLCWLDVSATAVTNRGIVKLQKALPQCRVIGVSDTTKE